MSPLQPPTDPGISVTTPQSEAELDWYREDPLANDHHAHWHYVYPRGLTQNPNGRFSRTQPRQGELFLYMHRQMLARYDTERRIAGLKRCEPFDDYGAPIEQGYELEGYRPRPAGREITDSTKLGELGEGFEEANGALENGSFKSNGGPPVSLGINALGAELESSALYANAPDAAPAPLRYLNFHGNGHLAISGASEQLPGLWRGPMYYVETAIRDPVFYRWHRHIDDFYASCQELETAHDLSEFAANVSFGAQDDSDVPSVGLCLLKDVNVPGIGDPDFDFGAWAAGAFGVDLTGGGPLVDELLTQFVKSDVTLAEPTDKVPGEWLQGVVHLTHEPFAFLIRIENLDPQPQDVTVRIFLAHADFAEDRRMWIELDKFHAALKPGLSLLARPDARSSVVKRKGLTVPGAEAFTGDSTDVWCDCGWPYTLLLPSGESAPEGSPFKLIVAVTDWNEDHLGEPDSCGSMSFCGAKNEYPDARPMGYPFDRPFAGSIADAVAAEPSMTMRDVRIRCTTERPSGG